MLQIRLFGRTILEQHSTNMCVSMVESITVLCPLFDEIEMLIPGDSSNIFPSLLQNVKFQFVIETTRKYYFIEAVQQT